MLHQEPYSYKLYAEMFMTLIIVYACTNSPDITVVSSYYIYI